MSKNKKKYSAIGKVNEEMNGAEQMTDQDFEQQETEKEEEQMEEKKHPIKDFVAAHKTGLKMAGLGILTFAVGALCGAAGNRNDAKSQKWGIRRDSADECPDLIEIDDEQDNVTTEDETTDSTVETTEV